MGGWCEKKRALRAALPVAGSDESCLCLESLWWGGSLAEQYLHSEVPLSVHIRHSEWEYHKCKHGKANSCFLQFRLEDLRFAVLGFLRRCYSLLLRLNDISRKRKGPGLELWATISPLPPCWAACARPLSLPDVGECLWRCVINHLLWDPLLGKEDGSM